MGEADRQLIWYKDHVLRNYDFERLAIEVQQLKKRLDEDNERSKNPLAPSTPLREWAKPEPEALEGKRSENEEPGKAKDQEPGLYHESE